MTPTKAGKPRAGDLHGREAIGGETRVYGILGHPVQHTFSPLMHNAAFAALEVDAVYLAFPVAPAGLPAALAGLAAAGVMGLNLTVPHKTAALPLLTEISPAARAIGAVNALRSEESDWVGTNTDGVGFMRHLVDDLNWEAAGKRVLMLGAGGAARAIGWHLLQSGVATLMIANRTQANAERLAADLRVNPGGSITTVPLESVAGLAPDLLVNTTTVGMGEDARSPIDLESVAVSEQVVDIVYAPRQTPLLRDAHRLGIPGANGLGMLLYQGVEAFEFFAARPAPVAVMRQALGEALGGV